ncbi:unnamed protein product [Protopolystoma xenopodis]|uniref:Uncharacterized protein n=1 Tax=Protopolystoma xenopodis TaxID=117903 RepID=A0A3S5FC70_9PLAT|nr:unnamed protein product [Protopolystoma xenopodis]
MIIILIYALQLWLEYKKIAQNFPVFHHDFPFSGIVQWLITLSIWEKCFLDRLRNFADLCCLANVSVFILSQANFGFYIHGHSPIGRADISLAGIVATLAAEQRGLTARRGLQPETDEHTYRMALPAGVRQAFNRLLSPITEATGSAGAGVGSAPATSGGGVAGTMGLGQPTTIGHVYHWSLLHETYRSVNRFLMRFISRVGAYLG